MEAGTGRRKGALVAGGLGMCRITASPTAVAAIVAGLSTRPDGLRRDHTGMRERSTSLRELVRALVNWVKRDQRSKFLGVVIRAIRVLFD